MITMFRCFLFTIFIGCLNIGPVQAFLSLPPQSLPTIVSEANIIALARVVNFSPVISFHNTSYPFEYTRQFEITAAGVYTFDILHDTTEDSKSRVEIGLPEALPENYGYSSFHVTSGSLVLLFLKRDTSGNLTPVEPQVPFVLVSNSSAQVPFDQTHSAVDYVLNCLFASTKDPLTQVPSIFFLSQFRDASVARELKPYENDSSLKLRDYALYAEILNQDVGAIPLAANLERELYPEENTTGSSATCLTALQQLNTFQATPYLNPLLFEVSEYTRINAVVALNRLADKTSIPYLILALQDPDPQQVIPHEAYGAIVRLVLPDQVEGVGDYNAHKVDVNSAIYTGWSAYLSGKFSDPKSPATSLDLVPGKGGSVGSTRPLYSQLFSWSSSERKAALDSLHDDPDPSAIPYLILTLRDPDPQLAFEAYSILHQLLPTVSYSADYSTFSGDRTNQLTPYFQWWSDELTGLHSLK